MALNHGTKPIVTDGLVLCLDAGDKNSYPGSGTTWTDLSGEGNNGTITNATFSTTAGGSISFDGTGDYVTNSGSYTNHQQSTGTIGAWVLLDINSENRYTIAVGGTTTSGATRAIRLYSTKWSCVAYGSGETEDWNTDVSATAGVWNHVVYVWNGTTIYFYLNGVAYGPTTRSGLVTPTGTVLRVGSETWDTSNPLKGKIATAFAYNTDISATEVKQNFNAHRIRFGL